MIKIWTIGLIVWMGILTASGQSWGALQVEAEPIGYHTVNDTLEFPIYLVQDPKNAHMWFGTPLETNVCNDQVCLPIQLNLFWDLLGNYHHFSREDGVNFTKFDHQYFQDEDYTRLQEILLDSLSALRDYQVEDLLDKKPQKFSFQVDAVTRPTSPLFSNVTVPGALYTVYTLWHIVNGPVKQELYAYTAAHYRDRDWAIYFAESGVPSYQEYFLKHLERADEKQFLKQVKQLLLAEDDFIPHYAVDVLESEVLKDPKQYNEILRDLEKMKPHVVTEIINKIANPNSEALAILASFRDHPKASVKQKELIEKLLNDEKQ